MIFISSAHPKLCPNREEDQTNHPTDHSTSIDMLSDAECNGDFLKVVDGSRYVKCNQCRLVIETSWITSARFATMSFANPVGNELLQMISPEHIHSSEIVIIICIWRGGASGGENSRFMDIENNLLS